MGHPVSSLDEWRSAAHQRIGEPHTVRRHAEVNVLLITLRDLCLDAIRFVSRRRRQFWLGQDLNVLRGKSEYSDGAGDILDGLFAQVRKRKRQLAFDLVVCRARNTQATRFAQRFQAGRDIDTVTEDVVTVYYDVDEIDADSNNDTIVLGYARIAANHDAVVWYRSTVTLRPHG